MSEFVYVLTNEAMPDMVKIGRTNDLAGRMRELYKSGVPLPFVCHYAVEVEDTAASIDIERKLHNLFDEDRVNKKREFFRVAPERVALALSIGNFKEASVTLEDTARGSGGEIDRTDIEAAERSEKRRENLRFDKIGIPVGATLTFSRDENITATTTANNKLIFEGREMSISGCAEEILNTRFGNHRKNGTQGPLYWKYNGYTLDELRQKQEDNDFVD
jgi:hypothetical protein